MSAPGSLGRFIRPLGDFTAAELQALPRETTVFWIPVGALEDHGPHLPIGQDLIEAEFLCVELSERLGSRLPDWNWILCPALATSVDSNTTRYALTSRGHVVRDYLVDTFGALARNGFRHFGVISGTIGPRQIVAIEDAARLIRRRAEGGPISRLLGRLSRQTGSKPNLFCPSIALAPREDCMRAPLYPIPLEHGGKTDTSVMLALEPSRVRDLAHGLPAASPQATGLSYLRARLRNEVGGYLGAPADARAELGRAELERRVDAMIIKTEAVLRGEKPELVLRSWYSAFPPNRSFFKAWAVALAIGAVMAAWVAWTARWMLTL